MNSTESICNDDIRRAIYKIIDRSLALAFIGGVLLGIIPFMISGDWRISSVFCLIFSLIIFFVARYSGLKILFKPNKDDDK